MPHRLLPPLAFAIVAAVLVSQGRPAVAQKKTPEVFTPAPQLPTLTSPAGLAVATGTTDITVTGTNLNGASGVLIAPPLKATIASKHKDDGARVAITVEVPKDAPIGLYPFRIATKTGISNLRAILVDDLPEVKESTNNTTKETAQAVPVPSAVTGRVEPETADFYRVPVKAGQTLTFEVLGRRIGSQLDPLIVLHDAKTKRELISLYADDTPGLQSDARLTHTFKEPGEILVEVRDTTYRGGANYQYRLRIGEFPGATTAFPLAVQRGQTASIGFTGPGTDAVPPVTVRAPTDPGVLALRVAPRFSKGPSGWPVQVRVSDSPEQAETEPNNDMKTATPLPVPGGVSGRFATPGDIDYYRFPAKKGEKLALSVLAYELNAPTEVLLRVVDDKGKELAKSNPALPTVKAEFTAPADGQFFAICEHLNFLSGPNEVYHLTVKPATGDFDFALPVDNLGVSPGAVSAIPITTITRSGGFSGPIEFRIVDSPVLEGSVTAPAGAAIVYLPVTAKAGTKPGAYAFRVQGTAKVGGKDVVRTGSTLELARAVFAGVPNPPLEFQGQSAAGVVESLPFTLTLTPEPIEKGKTGKLTIEAKRNGHDGEITLAPTSPPANVTITPKPVAKGATKSEATITLAAGTAAGPTPITLKATTKVGGKDYVLYVPAIITVTDAKKGEPKKEPAKAKAKK